jgi:hypothetical protein
MERAGMKPGVDSGVWIERAGLFALLLIGLWLLASVWWVRIELGDGYVTAVNARYLLGLAEEYVWYRAPLPALILVPAAWLADRLALGPLDMRPYHAVMLVVHLGCLLWMWRWMSVYCRDRVAALLAYLAALPCVFFFSYAPFISHDIAPGFLLLAMLIGVDRYARDGRLRTLALLALLGAMAATVKQTYALFWLLVLVAHATVIASERCWREGVTLVHLAGAALLSGVLSFFAYASVLQSVYPEAGFLERPFLQAWSIADNISRATGAEGFYYPWVYLRNFWVFGILAMVLVLPGLIGAWRAPGRIGRMVAVSWTVALIVMCLNPLKELRYLGFLMPLTAILVYHALVELRTRLPRLVWLPPLVLVVDLSLAGVEAQRIVHPYYRSGHTEFFAGSETAIEQGRRVTLAGLLNFVSPDRHAFFGDRYHRITHLMGWSIAGLYGLDQAHFRPLYDLAQLNAMDFQPGEILLYSNELIARVMPIRSDNGTSMSRQYLQFAGVAEPVGAVPEGDHYRFLADPAQRVLLTSDGQPLLISDGRVERSLLPVDPLADGSMPSISLMTFRITALCDPAGCRRTSD